MQQAGGESAKPTLADGFRDGLRKQGKVIRMLTIVDDCTRECPAIEVDPSVGGLRVLWGIGSDRQRARIAGAIVLDN